MANNHYKIPDKVKEYIRSIPNRRKMLEKCGPDAFLDPKKLRYPVKNPFTCKYDPNLIHAAYVRSHEFKDKTMMSKVNKLWELHKKDKLECNQPMMEFTDHTVVFDGPKTDRSLLESYCELCAI